MTSHESSASNGSTRVTPRKAAYALAAGAAAGLVVDADAQVVYSGVQDIDIPLGFAENLDVDGDGFNDVLLKNYTLLGGTYVGATVNYFPGQLVGFNSGLSYVSALSDGDLIDSTTVGPTFFGSMAYGAVNPNAEFNSVDGAFVGLSFPIAGATHFGWVRVSVDQAASTFVINDWAYESTPGEGLFAGEIPEPGTLGMLAAGAAGVGMMRSRRRREDD